MAQEANASILGPDAKFAQREIVLTRGQIDPVLVSRKALRPIGFDILRKYRWCPRQCDDTTRKENRPAPIRDPTKLSNVHKRPQSLNRAPARSAWLAAMADHYKIGQEAFRTVTACTHFSSTSHAMRPASTASGSPMRSAYEMVRRLGRSMRGGGRWGWL